MEECSGMLKYKEPVSETDETLVVSEEKLFLQADSLVVNL
jgi:hypothetical protein